MKNKIVELTIQKSLCLAEASSKSFDVNDKNAHVPINEIFSNKDKYAIIGLVFSQVFVFMVYNSLYKDRDLDLRFEI